MVVVVVAATAAAVEIVATVRVAAAPRARSDS